MCCSRKYPYPYQRSFFCFPTPLESPVTPHNFLQKFWLLRPSTPSEYLPTFSWDGYGYFLDTIYRKIVSFQIKVCRTKGNNGKILIIMITMVTIIVYLQGFLKIKFATDMEGQKVFLYGPNIILTLIFSSLPSEVWLQNQKWFTIGSIHSFSSEQPFILAAFTKGKKMVMF